MSPDVRRIERSDGGEIAALSESCPDTGAIQSHSSYVLNAYDALQALRRSTVGLGAFEEGRLIAAIFVSYGEYFDSNRLHRYALMHTLMVHPNHRRRGLGSALVRGCVERVQAEAGKATLLLANVQDENVGSLRAFAPFVSPFGRYRTAVVPIQRWLARRSSDRVRTARPDDFAAIARGRNQFYQDHALGPQDTEASLDAWQTAGPSEVPLVRQLYVATDRKENILAGASLVAQFRVRTVRVTKGHRLPLAVGRLIGAIPKSGVIRQVVVERSWCTPGNAGAIARVWRGIFADIRGQSDIALFPFDPKSPVRDALRLPPFAPTSSALILHSGSGELFAGRPVCPIW